MKSLGMYFGIDLRKASVELLDSIPSVDCREVRRVFDIKSEKWYEGDGFHTDCFVIGSGESCRRSISQSSLIG